MRKWSKINEFEIKDNELMIRTPYKIFKIPFNDIDRIETEKMIPLLNRHLSRLFKGELVYDGELKIVKEADTTSG